MCFITPKSHKLCPDLFRSSAGGGWSLSGSAGQKFRWLVDVWIHRHNKMTMDMGMDQYLLIPFLVGWTSIYQLFWCELQGYYWFWHTAICIFWLVVWNMWIIFSICLLVNIPWFIDGLSMLMDGIYWLYILETNGNTGWWFETWIDYDFPY